MRSLPGRCPLGLPPLNVTLSEGENPVPLTVRANVPSPHFFDPDTGENGLLRSINGPVDPLLELLLEELLVDDPAGLMFKVVVAEGLPVTVTLI